MLSWNKTTTELFNVYTHPILILMTKENNISCVFFVFWLSTLRPNYFAALFISLDLIIFACSWWWSNSPVSYVKSAKIVGSFILYVWFFAKKKMNRKIMRALTPTKLVWSGRNLYSMVWFFNVNLHSTAHPLMNFIE